LQETAEINEDPGVGPEEEEEGTEVTEGTGTEEATEVVDTEDLDLEGPDQAQEGEEDTKPEGDQDLETT